MLVDAIKYTGLVIGMILLFTHLTGMAEQRIIIKRKYDNDVDVPVASDGETNEERKKRCSDYEAKLKLAAGKGVLDAEAKYKIQKELYDKANASLVAAKAQQEKDLVEIGKKVDTCINTGVGEASIPGDQADINGV